MAIQGKTVLAIIPAREGSRRCPLKNITLFRQKPLILWALEHAASSKFIDSTTVSSDSDAILNWAKPPTIKLLRPAFLASDSATSEAVIAHALYSLPSLPDIFVLLQPTSPLRLPADIDACISKTASTSQPCVSVTPDHIRNGAVYSWPTATFLSKLSLGGAIHHIMPTERSLDIDMPEDFLQPLSRTQSL